MFQIDRYDRLPRNSAKIKDVYKYSVSQLFNYENQKISLVDLSITLTVQHYELISLECRNLKPS